MNTVHYVYIGNHEDKTAVNSKDHRDGGKWF